MKCVMCIDKLISEDKDAPEAAGEAVTEVAIVQSFSIGGQQIMSAVVVPVCFGCRKDQLGAVSKKGLVTA